MIHLIRLQMMVTSKKDKDANGNPKMSEEEFMEELRTSKDIEHSVFGLIQAEDFHVQYEPFAEAMS